jgi:hypothetical protein
MCPKSSARRQPRDGHARLIRLDNLTRPTMNNGRILLMRHAEKTDDPLDPKLSVAGSDRAQKTAQYIP